MTDTGPGFSLETFQGRRERLLETLADGVAVLPAAPELLISRDTEVRYRPDSNLFYLTGFSEPGAVAVLTPHDPEHRYTLFVRDRDPERERWNGPRTGREEAKQGFGADAVYPLSELDARLKELVEPARRLFYALGSDTEMDRRVVELCRGFRHSRQRSGRGPTGVEDLDPVLGRMRRIKEPAEIASMRAAARLAAGVHREVMARARPGAGEWQLEAAILAGFREQGASGPAYPPIVASGPNATVLHHSSNDRRIQDGDLVLVDAGAWLGMYSSDITRTFPVSGKFSEVQRAVYQVVLRAEEIAIARCRPGTPVCELHDGAVGVLAEGMIELGLLEGDAGELVAGGAHKRFFMHQTSHWLGIDVHDAGPYSENGEPVLLEPGMVLTVEPGVYVPADDESVPERLRGIGVRVEDTVLVTDDAPELLTRGVPVEPGEVEELVGKS